MMNCLRHVHRLQIQFLTIVKYDKKPSYSSQQSYCIMQYKTSTYFFPTSCPRVRHTSVDSSILLHQKKQIKAHLAGFIAQNCHPSLSKSTPKNNHNQRRHTQLSLVKDSITPKHKIPQTVKFDSSSKKNFTVKSIGIFNLLQRAKQLQEEDNKMGKNPFYKIQKKRLFNMKFRSNQQHNQGLNLSVLEKEVQKSQLKLSEIQQPIFQNQSLIRMVRDDSRQKMRNKSETVMYYEIKSYYQEKYARKVNTSNARSSNSKEVKQ